MTDEYGALLNELLQIPPGTALPAEKVARLRELDPTAREIAPVVETTINEDR